MANYIKCPRCDLNYIDADVQELCDVCLAELKGTKLKFADLDDDELLDEDELDELDEEVTEICPVCGINRMRVGETMCDSCKEKSVFDEEEPDEDIDADDDEEWKTYLADDETDEDLTMDDALLEEEMEEDEEDDLYSEEDADPFSDYDSLGDDELGDDEDDEDDEDDDDDDF